MNILKDFRNDLLKRREIKLVVTESKNPGIDYSKKLIAEKFKASEENVVVKGLKSKFGIDTFLIDAFIYDSKDIMDKIEPKKKAKKTAPGAS